MDMCRELLHSGLQQRELAARGALGVQPRTLC